MKPKKNLTRKQLLTIKSIWMTAWNKKSLPPGGMSEAWYEVILEFLAYEGAQITPGEVEELEMIVSEKGLADEYWGALAELTNMPFDLTEGEKFIHLIHSPVEKRLQALRYVLSI